MRPKVYQTRQEGFHAKARGLTTEDLRVMELPERYWDAKRDEIDENERAREVVESYGSKCPEIVRRGEPSFVLFHGSHGSGKTSAAAIMAKVSRAHRFTTFFLDGAGILKDFPTHRVTADGELEARERAYESEVLVLDALGQGYVTNDYVVAETLALIKYRQDHRMLTIGTTSLKAPELDTVYGPSLRPLIKQTGIIVRCVGPEDVHLSAASSKGYDDERED